MVEAYGGELMSSPGRLASGTETRKMTWDSKVVDGKLIPKTPDEKYDDKFEVLLTIDGTENKYAKMIYKKYKYLKNIKFIGLQSREKVFEIYAQSDCLIFPSKLETWGLPITEYKLFNKPILVADLTYAHETVGNYNKVNFFEPDDAQMLARYIVAFLENNLIFVKHAAAKKSRLKAESWSELCNILLNTEVNK
jgi:glycosyltransferase involved in cell wall biosynthesis